MYICTFTYIHNKSASVYQNLDMSAMERLRLQLSSWASRKD